jgi:hypothetical protein
MIGSMVAFATSTGTRRLEAPGITVAHHIPADPRSGAGDVHNTIGVTGGHLPLDAEGWLDEDAADHLLETMGYQRTGPWGECGGGQWSAEIERKPAGQDS